LKKERCLLMFLKSSQLPAARIAVKASEKAKKL